MRRLATVATGLLLLLALAALGALGWFHWAQGEIAAHMRPPQLQLQRKAAPDFVFQDLDGKPQTLSAYRGKVVFLDLWGTWCVQCVAEMPTVQKLYDRYRADPHVQMLIVSRLDSPSRIRTYAERNGYTLPFFRMRDADIPPSMQFQQYPTTFVLDKAGQIVTEHVGAADWSSPSVAHLINQLKDE